LDPKHVPDTEKDNLKFGKLGRVNLSGSINSFAVSINGIA
jgi:hypothetical protein